MCQPRAYRAGVCAAKSASETKGVGHGSVDALGRLARSAAGSAGEGDACSEGGVAVDVEVERAHVGRGVAGDTGA